MSQAVSFISSMRTWVDHQPGQLLPSRAELEVLPALVLMLCVMVAVKSSNHASASELLLVAVSVSVMIWQTLSAVRHRHSFDAWGMHVGRTLRCRVCDSRAAH